MCKKPSTSSKMATKNLPLAPRQAETGFRFSPTWGYNFFGQEPRTCSHHSARIPDEQLTRRCSDPRAVELPSHMLAPTARINIRLHFYAGGAIMSSIHYTTSQLTTQHFPANSNPVADDRRVFIEVSVRSLAGHGKAAR